MSDHRTDVVEALSPVPYARCPKRTCESYVARGRKKEPGEKKDPGWLWCGAQRAPEREDERGALHVIDLHLGGRVALYALASDDKHLRVESLP